MARRRRHLIAAIAVVIGMTVVAACAPSEPAPTSSSPSAAPSPSADIDAIREELLAMLAADQAERTGEVGANDDASRTERLREIIDEIGGWPTISRVGAEAETAAWAIAQHSDLDPSFQREALELLRAAVDDGDASAGNLAYLEDRVAVAAGEPQLYGTQIGCGANGAEAATPIRDEADVEQRRADAGLPPLADYLAEMTAICAQDG